MTSDPFDYDPDRALWKPGRRSFFFGLSAALLGSMLPDVPVVQSPQNLVFRKDFAQFVLPGVRWEGWTWDGQVMVRYSNDNGKTWSPVRYA